MATEPDSVPSFSVLPMTFADIERLHRDNWDPMKDDRQTQLKKLGDVPYLRPGSGVAGDISTLKNPKYAFVSRSPRYLHMFDTPRL